MFKYRVSFRRAHILAAATLTFALLFMACASPAAPSPTAAPAKPAAPTAAPAATAAAAAPAATTAPAATAAPAKPTKEKVKVGFMFDGAGPTANVGTRARDGAKDWNDYVNAVKGGVNGHPVEFLFEDNKYEVPTAVNIYKRWVEQEKTPIVMTYGTPIAEALTPSAAKDKVPIVTPGFGLSDSEDGNKFPYTFVGVASYSAQGSAVLQWIKNNWKESRNPKVGILHYDNPAGRDPLEAMKKVATKLNIDITKIVAVPATSVDTASQILELQKDNPDFVISHLFGRLPGISLKDRGRLGVKTPFISLTWGISEDEIQVAGDAAEGYMGVQYTAITDDKPEAMEAIRQWYQSQGKQVPANFNNVFYSRGVMIAALIHEGIAAGGDPVTGENIKKGFESLKNFTAYGMLGGTTITPENHGGTRKIRLHKVEGGKLKMVQDWIEGPTW